MSGIEGPGLAGTAAAVKTTLRLRRSEADFSVADEAASVAGGAPAAAPAAAGMLALQEIDGGADREAARHGRRILAALAGLQHALLGGGVMAATVAELRGLLAQLPQSSDPALRFALQAVALRARVELARRDPEAHRPSP